MTKKKTELHIFDIPLAVELRHIGSNSHYAFRLYGSKDEQQLSFAIQRAMSTLDSRERFITRGFYGILCKKLTLAEMAKKLNISAGFVHQLKGRALRKLGHHSRRRHFTGFLQ